MGDTTRALSVYKNINRQAKLSLSTKTIITSPKWEYLVTQASSRHEINDLQGRTREFCDSYHRLINIIADYLPLEDWFTNTLVNHPIIRNRKMDLHKYEYLTHPEVLDSNIKDALHIEQFLSETLHLFTQASLNKPSPTEDNVNENDIKTQIAILLSTNHMVEKIEENFETLTQIVGEIWAPTVKKTDTGAYKEFATYKERAAWQKTLIKYYAKQLRINESCLQLPNGYTIKPFQNSYVKTITFPEKLHTPSIIDTVLPTIYTSEPQNPTTPSPSQIDKKIVFPESTTTLYNTLAQKQFTVQGIYNELTLEEQHHTDSLRDTHLPVILHHLGLLIQTNSPDLPKATEHCNTALNQSITKLDTIVERFNKDTLHKLINETTAVTNIMNTQTHTQDKGNHAL